MLVCPPVDREEEPGARSPGRRTALPALAVGVWGTLILVAHVRGAALLRAGVALHLPAPPLYAAFEPRLNPWIVPALVVGAVVVVAAGRADGLRWRGVVLLTAAAAAAWAAALALAGGPGALSAPLLDPHDYLHDVPLVGSPSALLSGFGEEIGRYTTHVRSHPPGMLLFAWSLAETGLGNPAVLAGIIIAVGASAGAAALVALREVAGEAAARRAAPFVALAPAALWIATSADGLFAGVGAWGVALTVLATGDRRHRAAYAAAGGVLLGSAAFLSYGLVLLGAVPAAVAVSRRRPAVLAWAAAGAALVAAVFASQGFVWWEGLWATRIEYHAGAASERPYGYFLLADAAALAIALGPACAGALAKLRDRRVWLLAGAAFAAVATAALSGLSKGEVERIWLPFMPWILVAVAALPSARARSGRGWLAAQAATAIAVQSLFLLPW